MALADDLLAVTVPYGTARLFSASTSVPTTAQSHSGREYAWVVPPQANKQYVGSPSALVPHSAPSAARTSILIAWRIGP